MSLAKWIIHVEFFVKMIPSDKKNTITKFQSKDGEKWFIITNKRIDTKYVLPVFWNQKKSNEPDLKQSLKPMLTSIIK